MDSLIKIFPGDAVRSRHWIHPELWAARGQHVSVQLALRYLPGVPTMDAVEAESLPAE